MKKLLLILLGHLALSGVALAQSAVLDQQAFGTVNGGTTLDSVGWSQIFPPAGFSGIYTQGGAISGTTSQALPTSTLYFGGGAGSGSNQAGTLACSNPLRTLKLKRVRVQPSSLRHRPCRASRIGLHIPPLPLLNTCHISSWLLMASSISLALPLSTCERVHQPM